MQQRILEQFVNASMPEVFEETVVVFWKFPKRILQRIVEQIVFVNFSLCAGYVAVPELSEAEALINSFLGRGSQRTVEQVVDIPGLERSRRSLL